MYIIGGVVFWVSISKYKETPGEIFSEVKKKYKTTTIKPFLDYIKEEKMDGEKIGLNERSFFKNFNRKNAIIIEGKEDDIEIILVTNLYGRNSIDARNTRRTWEWWFGETC